MYGSPRTMRTCTVGRALGLIVALGALVLTGCSGSREASPKPPDQRYGHRYEARGPEGHPTLTVTPPDSGRSYFYYEAPVSEVIARAASFEGGQEAVPAELLIKGALPNECLALHEATQDRDGHFLTVHLTMRWPQKALCESLERPFRFYLPLEGRYPPGDYTLKLNGYVYPFSIRPDD